MTNQLLHNALLQVDQVNFLDIKNKIELININQKTIQFNDLIDLAKSIKSFLPKVDPNNALHVKTIKQNFAEWLKQYTHLFLPMLEVFNARYKLINENNFLNEEEQQLVRILNKRIFCVLLRHYAFIQGNNFFYSQYFGPICLLSFDEDGIKRLRAKLINLDNFISSRSQLSQCNNQLPSLFEIYAYFYHQMNALKPANLDASQSFSQLFSKARDVSVNYFPLVIFAEANIVNLLSDEMFLNKKFARQASATTAYHVDLMLLSLSENSENRELILLKNYLRLMQSWIIKRYLNGYNPYYSHICERPDKKIFTKLKKDNHKKMLESIEEALFKKNSNVAEITTHELITKFIYLGDDYPFNQIKNTLIAHNEQGGNFVKKLISALELLEIVHADMAKTLYEFQIKKMDMVIKDDENLKKVLSPAFCKTFSLTLPKETNPYETFKVHADHLKHLYFNFNNLLTMKSKNLHDYIIDSDCKALKKILHLFQDNINFVDKNGLSPLALAIKTNNMEAVKILLEHGANIAWKGKIDGADYDLTLLHLAISYHAYEALPLLIQLNCPSLVTSRSPTSVLNFKDNLSFFTDARPLVELVLYDIEKKHIKMDELSKFLPLWEEFQKNLMIIYLILPTFHLIPIEYVGCALIKTMVNEKKIIAFSEKEKSFLIIFYQTFYQILFQEKYKNIFLLLLDDIISTPYHKYQKNEKNSKMSAPFFFNEKGKDFFEEEVGRKFLLAQAVESLVAVLFAKNSFTTKSSHEARRNSIAFYKTYASQDAHIKIEKEKLTASLYLCLQELKINSINKNDYSSLSTALFQAYKMQSKLLNEKKEMDEKKISQLLIKKFHELKKIEPGKQNRIL